MTDKWQPISTAPKDGAFIAAVHVHNNGVPKFWEMHIVWRDEDTGNIADECERGWTLEDYSHWQPLPAPPSEHGERE